MNSFLVGSIIVVYFSILIFVSYLTSKNVDNDSFFTGNKKAPWYLIAFGMIGTSLSGVTFIAVPGWVGNTNFYYYQIVIGYFLGYLVIANILLPLYYKLQLTSIYTYLENRFGDFSYKTGASFFLISKLIGAGFRLFIVARVLQITFFNHFNIPFAGTAIATILLIWVYTYKGGIKTIIWTDSLQTVFMLLAVIISIFILASKLSIPTSEIFSSIRNSEYSEIFNWDVSSKFFFAKQVLSGAFITIVMTGLDQDMMQKNLSCRNLKDAKKNMYWYGSSFLLINLLFLGLGALLYMYIAKTGMQDFGNSMFSYNAEKGAFTNTDDLYPFMATNTLGIFAGITFLIGIIAAAFSSADSALAALTTSFTIDIVGIKNKTEQHIKKIRQYSHIIFSVLLAAVILLFNAINDNTVIDAIFTAAGYTYGPILGMFSFGIFTTRKAKDAFVPYIAIAAPILAYAISVVTAKLWSYNFGYEILILNGLLCFIGIFATSKKTQTHNQII